MEASKKVWWFWKQSISVFKREAIKWKPGISLVFCQTGGGLISSVFLIHLKFEIGKSSNFKRAPWQNYWSYNIVTYTNCSHLLCRRHDFSVPHSQTINREASKKRECGGGQSIHYFLKIRMVFLPAASDRCIPSFFVGTVWSKYWLDISQSLKGYRMLCNLWT